MTIVNQVQAQALVSQLSKDLKEVKAINPPKWATYVKTGAHKERPPALEDWWYSRTAAVLRSVAKLGPVGVSKLRTKFGGKKNRGHKPEEFRKGSGNIIRKALQQLETAGFIKKADIGIHKGRVLTPSGIKFVNSSAKKVK